eukprot:TRINITY_DN1610_c0_g1_i17.p1 TRINITY_DN1610_c0_g1~~TRINITY_DN1610_c0_g1_i17.p1  ORF type:complete len:176 (+),score=24.35 TRINITY_DN1610_c0_g1_i17:41-568(+)
MTNSIPVFVSFPDLGFENTIYEARESSTIKNMITAVAKEWNVRANDVDILFEGEEIRHSRKVFSLGVGADSHFEAVKKIRFIVTPKELRKQFKEICNMVSENPCLQCVIDSPDWNERITLPPGLRRLSFVNCEQINVFWLSFKNEECLTSIDLSAFYNTTRIVWLLYRLYVYSAR